MATMSVHLRSLRGTQASVGWAGGHTVVVDRPSGKAGGMGLGFNGGELLALAIGGCFCNDLHYVAHEMGVGLRSIEVEVELTFEGSPALATRAAMRVTVTAQDAGTDTAALIAKAEASSTISNSLRRGIPVEIVGRSGPT